MANRGGSRGGRDYRAGDVVGTGVEELAPAIAELSETIKENTKSNGGSVGGSVQGSVRRTQFDHGIYPSNGISNPFKGILTGFGPGLRTTAVGRRIARGAGRVSTTIGAAGTAGGVAGIGVAVGASAAVAGAGVAMAGVNAGVGAAVTTANVAGMAARNYFDDTVSAGEKMLRGAKGVGGFFGGQLGSDVVQAAASYYGLEKTARVDRTTRGNVRGLISNLIGQGITPDSQMVGELDQAFRTHNRRIEDTMDIQKSLEGSTEKRMKELGIGFQKQLDDAVPALGEFVTGLKAAVNLFRSMGWTGGL